VVVTNADEEATSMTDTARTVDPIDLPEPVTSYLAAHRVHDIERAIRTFAPDAAVTDEGVTHTGRDAIRTWMSRAATEYTYTIELTAVARNGDGRYDLTQHLEGDFPGGQVDLHFRFTVHDGAIVRLTIEP
jgi:ketosteroid isomerase-like protein